MENAIALPALLARAGRRPLQAIRAALAARRSRRALARLDARLLDDAGIDSNRAKIEAARPVWDVPANWLR